VAQTIKQVLALPSLAITDGQNVTSIFCLTNYFWMLCLLFGDFVLVQFQEYAVSLDSLV
jgi:hypothetical protein